MARIRTIKPEFFTSEDIAFLTPLARLFFIGLWCEADREGRLSWKPKTLKFRYLPADNIDIDLIGQELIEQKLIETYEVEGKQYAQILSFSKHQVINNRESKSTIPEKDAEAGKRIDASSTRESGVKAEGKEGKEGKGREGKSRKHETQISDKFQITEEMIEWSIKEGVRHLVESETDKFKDYATSKAKTYKDWNAAWRNWMRNALKFSQNSNYAANQPSGVVPMRKPMPIPGRTA